MSIFANFQDRYNQLGRMAARPGYLKSDFRTLATLPKDAWERVDEIVVEVAKDELVIFADVLAAGLTSDHDIGDYVSTYQRVLDLEPATLSMDGILGTQADATPGAFDWVSVPVPVAVKEFTIPWRQQAASESAGFPLDELSVDLAARRVSEAYEDQIINGLSTIGTVNGATGYGFLDHPDRNIVSGSDWGTATNIEPNVNSALSAIQADGYGGDVRLYVPSAQYRQLTVSNTNTDRTHLERLLNGIPELESVRRAPDLPAGTALLVRLQRAVVDIAVALPIAAREWAPDPSVMRHAVWAVQVARVKSDGEGGAGFAVITGI